MKFRGIGAAWSFSLVPGGCFGLFTIEQTLALTVF